MSRTYSKPLWLIARYRTGGIEALKIPLATGGEALPVFSFEDEARMFLGLGAFDGDWCPRETSAGEVISMLYCLCAGVDRMVLDPLPAPFAGLHEFPSIRREAFMDFAGEQGRSVPLVRMPSTGLARQRTRTARTPRMEDENGRERRSSQRVSDARALDATAHMTTPERR